VLPEIGPLQTFGLMFGLGFVAAGAIIARRLRELSEPVDWAYEIAFAALVGGFLGARIYWILDNWEQVSGDVLGNAFSGSGLTWYGGALGGALGVALWARWRGQLSLATADLVAPALAFGYAVGRVGCQLSGDGDYGEAWDGPWAMAYPDGVVPTTQEVHPTPIYETVAMGLGAWGLWLLRDRVRPGVLWAGYLVLAGTERFLVEFVRRNEPAVGGLTAAQLTSLGLLLVGLVWLGVVAARGGLGRGAGPVPAT
jgi:phosphatidylglycerol:prolipoprotein diacylglycerol transferase